MEAGSEGEKKKPPEGENKTKRKMKTASQLEVLEKTYSVEPYPSESLRAELSAELGLSDRQLQMWFCHRRLKDRKASAQKKPRSDLTLGTVISTPVGGSAEQTMMDDITYEGASVSGLRPLCSLDSWQVVPRPGMAFPRIGGGLPAMDYYESQQCIAELRAIAFVEAQLGEPIREDGPILGMEFDPLPPDAFGAPIGSATMGQHGQSGRPFEAKIYERQDKGVSRTLHEYQFIPEKPTVRNEAHERVAPSHHYNSLEAIPHSRTSILSSGRSFYNGNETATYGYGFQGQIPRLNLLSEQGRQNHVLPSASGENVDVPQKNLLVDVAVDTHIGAYPITQIDNSLMPSDWRVIHGEELTRLQRKHKNEEARMQREIEVQEKRIRKELEKQDILKRKREEQVRKEMERQDRERRKEEERLLRERQREEERCQREQRRELERREKFLQKESIRAEKMRQKEELRRVKEAARIKTANERAVARRMAKESMELIEDERLELMELTASKKGLSSILSLDHETLHNLELYRDGQASFPPKSVRLKRPFSIQPWSDSEENVGNLLMVWRFLITFIDVLGMWPFTLDEFIQAFHDYDPRLLSEIHIALLKTIIKDIEDVARTPFTGVGTNQNSAANSGGGHLQVIEGAYVWGFDIRNWQRHLNLLTWPEILRQFALSAGFGPQLKKRNIERGYPCDNNEGNDFEDIISNLRTGVAVENAVAIMQERGLYNQRRSRHCLTPGTVKFAAFHVLSLEGSNGLTILEVAEKIQKSGLRDLTTSKTPEASIAAALSRDSKLFERTAPSTYCVRPAYRKDPANADSILSAARERIRIFKSGSLDTEEPDDGERDEDSESDVAEDNEVEDLAMGTNTKKEPLNSEEFNERNALRSRKDGGEVLRNPDDGYEKVSKGITSVPAEDLNAIKDTGESVDPSSEIAAGSNDVANSDVEDANIDESNLGEPWVLVLMEGEYSDLSVEERLNALVALIGVTIEGNSIRVALEERLEAANALKKQMWSEAQLDKRRLKDDCFVKIQSAPNTGNKNEPTVSVLSTEGKHSPLLTANEKNDEAIPTSLDQLEQTIDLQNNQNHLQSFHSEINTQIQDFFALPDNYSFQQSGYIAEKARSNLKSYIGHLAEETYMYRSLPLGLDRRHNRYWQFTTSASQNDPGCGRIFVELYDCHWRLIDSEEGFDALMASLDVRGMRESHLHMMLNRIKTSFKESIKRNVPNAMRMQNVDLLKTKSVEMSRGQVCSAISSACNIGSDESETSTSFLIQIGKNENDKKDAFRRYQDFEKWMQMECLNSSVLFATTYGKKRCSQLLGMCDYCRNVAFTEEVPCSSCHRTLRTCNSNFNSAEHLAQKDIKVKAITDYPFLLSPSCPLRMRLLKVLFSVLEASIPNDALQPLWTDSYRKSWSRMLRDSSLAEDLLQILTVLESAIKREHLASNYETTSELLGSRSSSGCLVKDTIGAGGIRVLPWVPRTTAAVALRFMELDASIFYTLQQKLESEKDKKIKDVVVKFSSKSTSAKNPQSAGATETSNQAEHTKENWVDLGAGLASYSRGQRTIGRGRGLSRDGRSRGKGTSSKSKSRKTVIATRRRLGQVLGWKEKPRVQGGHKRGRRSIRIRQKPAANDPPKEDIKEESPGLIVREQFNGDETIGFEMEAAGNASISERSDEEDNKNNQATDDEYDYGYGSGIEYNRKSENIIQRSDYTLDDEEDEDINDDLDVDVDDSDGMGSTSSSDYSD
ncbi:hypothetical protein L6164_022386 [Bauhinia variegata]|uniref:Uncharacterized protein n=1 Tax=Bauhinia variegata TaxID=167791 RepID=A0ACB9MGV9_BAUVA|nr:hypothetical protein L6164_022386 [Bauhinia variegata]